jgi:hypothetical protein
VVLGQGVYLNTFGFLLSELFYHCSALIFYSSVTDTVIVAINSFHKYNTSPTSLSAPFYVQSADESLEE